MPKAAAAGLIAVIALIILPTIPDAQDARDRYWPQWRGPHHTGVSTTATPPLTWSETENIRWKVEIPGRGSSSPIVWEDRLYVLTAVPVGVDGDAQHDPRGGERNRGVHQFLVMALDRAPVTPSGSTWPPRRNPTNPGTSTTTRGHHRRR